MFQLYLGFEIVGVFYDVLQSGETREQAWGKNPDGLAPGPSCHMWHLCDSICAWLNSGAEALCSLLAESSGPTNLVIRNVAHKTETCAALSIKVGFK